MIHDPDKIRLGKHLGVVQDPRTIRFGQFLAPAAQLPPIPRTVGITNKVKDWPMYLNDIEATCTCASSGHRLLGDSTREGHPVKVSDKDVQAAYNRVNGGRDNGAYMLDVANLLRTTGIAGHKVAGFMKVDIRDWDHVKLGMRLFGGIWLGIALPISAQGQSEWLKVGDGTGDSAPGSWGGHAVWAGWVEDLKMSCVTWGQKKAMSRAFVQTYVDEAYLLIDPAWLGKDAKSPQGFNLAQLQGYLKELS